MPEAQAIVEAVIGLVKYLIPFAVVLGAVYLVSKVGLEAVKSFFTGNGPWGPIAAVAIVAIIALGAGLVYKPTSVTSLIDFSFGADREKKVLDTEAYAFVTNPFLNPQDSENPVIKRRATVEDERGLTDIREEQLEQAKLNVKIANLLPTGDPQRKLWDDAKEDPLSKTGPEWEQRIRQDIKNTDWERVNATTAAPIIPAENLSKDTPKLIRGIAPLPMMFGIWAMVLVSAIVLGIWAKFTFH